jgi:prepilin-type N-terminal cleavage/methylation domain-containing protein
MLRSTVQRHRRVGFTLIELLVVIAIIVVLAALGVGAGYTVIEGQRASRTEDFMRTIDKQLHQHWRKVVDDAKAEQSTIPDSVVNLAGADRDRALVIWIKFRLMEAFPQSYAEIRAPWVYNFIPVGMRKYNDSYLKAIGAAPGGKPGESAACLYLALRENRGGVKLDEENFASNIIDTDNDGVKELVDAWGKPLTFVRFPLGTTATPSVLSAQLLAELNTKNPNKTTKGLKYGDPDDPEGLLQINAWLTSANGKIFTANVHKVANPQPYFLPVLISNAGDGVFNTADDIYSWRLRLGVKGN